jgi:flagellar export protein FliJ
VSPFRFRLDLPLRLARVRRDELRRDLGDALRDAATADERCAAARAGIVELGRELVLRSTAEGLTGAEVAWLSQQREHRREALPRLEGRREQAAARENEVRDRLQAVSREARVLERARERAHERWRRDLERRQQRKTDDLVLMRHTRALLKARRERS